MFPLMMPMLIGGGMGLLTNRKNPLKGALIGAGLGAAGGSMSGLLSGGASPVMPVPDGSSVVDLAGTSAAGLTAPVQPGLLQGLNQYKPVMDAAGLGLSAANSLKGDQPQQGPAQFSFGAQSGPEALSGIYRQGQQGVSDQLAMSEQERMRRRMSRRGLMG